MQATVKFSQSLPWEGTDKLPAREVSRFLHGLLSGIDVPEKTLAQAVGMAESQFHRMYSSKAGFVKSQTIQPFKRAAILLDEALATLSEEGAHRWLSTPNPYLNDVAPILCLRSDKELEKVLALLSSIRLGYPA